MIPLLLWACGAPTPSEPPPEPAPEVPEAPVEGPEILPAWDPGVCSEPMTLDWSPLGQGRGGLKHAKAPVADLDGDGKIEVFTVLQDAGSGFATVQATLTLSDSDPIELNHTWSYNEMVHVIEVPPALRGPDKADWRLPFEAELLRIKCPKPDPMLEWLLQTPPQPTWYAGRAILPSLYGVYTSDSEQWTVISAHTHTMDPPPVGSWPVTDEAKGDLEVQRTQHGAILYDRARNAHRWLYVSRQGSGKLRAPTVALTGFEGDGVIVARNGAPGEPAPPVHVELASGKVVEERSQSQANPR